MTEMTSGSALDAGGKQGEYLFQDMCAQINEVIFICFLEHINRFDFLET